jgi:hypothetical protein
MPPLNPMKVARDGKVVVCYANMKCARNVLNDASHEPTSRLIDTTITRDYFGAPGTPQRYVILVVPLSLAGVKRFIWAAAQFRYDRY